MKNEIKFGFESPNESTGFLLWQTHMIWQRKIKEELDKLGITHTQFVLLSVLAWLSKSANIITQTDISNQSHTDRMMVSKVLRTLEGKGYVKRENNEVDTRIKAVSLTSNGEKLLQIAIEAVENVDRVFFSKLAKQDSFRKDLTTLMNNEIDNTSLDN